MHADVLALQPPRRVLVLGGSGFIGRHAVAALLAAGCEVTIGSRHPRRIGRRVPELSARCRHLHCRLERMTGAASWDAALAGCDVVVNCVGILRQRLRETYARVHVQAPAALAQACRARGIRLLHVSALGLHADARSRFLRSKLAGEEAMRASGADWYIVRPSLLDGDGGYGARWLRRIARWPIHALPGDATGRIAALHVADLGEALAAIALAPRRDVPEDDRIIELGGLASWCLADYVAAIRSGYSATPAIRWAVPSLLARMTSHVCDLLHATPFSFGHWELLRRDNCPRINQLPAWLGREPRTIGSALDASSWPHEPVVPEPGRSFA